MLPILVSTVKKNTCLHYFMDSPYYYDISNEQINISETIKIEINGTIIEGRIQTNKCGSMNIPQECRENGEAVAIFQENLNPKNCIIIYEDALIKW